MMPPPIPLNLPTASCDFDLWPPDSQIDRFMSLHRVPLVPTGIKTACSKVWQQTIEETDGRTNGQPENICLRLPISPGGGNPAKLSTVITRSAAAGFGRHGMPPPVYYLDLWPFDLETGVRVASKVGNRHSEFGDARPLGSRIIRYVVPERTDRRTDRQTDKSNAYCPFPTVGGIIIIRCCCCCCNCFFLWSLLHDIICY